MSRFAARVLARHRLVAPDPTLTRGECRIEDASGLICDPATGKYPHIVGRCCYGVRRQGRDVADTAELSPSAIESFGGWMPGSDIPNRIYRERANKVGGREARGARALLRGENVA